MVSGLIEDKEIGPGKKLKDMPQVTKMYMDTTVTTTKKQTNNKPPRSISSYCFNLHVHTLYTHGTSTHAHHYTGWEAKAKAQYLVMAIRAKATLLFCPPERDTTGLMASSPLTPKEPSWWRYCSSVSPAHNTGCR